MVKHVYYVYHVLAFSQVWPSVQSYAGSSEGWPGEGRSLGQKWPCSTTLAWEEQRLSHFTRWVSQRRRGEQEVANDLLLVHLDTAHTARRIFTSYLKE